MAIETELEMNMDSRIRLTEHRWLPFALEFREVFVNIKLADIDKTFNSEGIFLLPEQNKREEELQAVLKMRKARAHVYLENINWQNLDLKFLGNLLRRVDHLVRSEYPEYASKMQQDYLFELSLLGIEIRSDWNLEPEEMLLHAMPIPLNATGIQKELNRINRGLAHISEDPHALVGNTKNLIEACAKLVLFEFGEEHRKDEKVDALISRARTLLEIHNNKENMPSYEKKLLANIGQIAIAINEFRNTVNGTGGHGSFAFDISLNLPTARLLVDSGVAWVRFALAVLEIRKDSFQH